MMPLRFPKVLDPLRWLRSGYRFQVLRRQCNIPAYRKVGMKVLDMATSVAGGQRHIAERLSSLWAKGDRSNYIKDSGMSAGSESLCRPRTMICPSGGADSLPV